MRLIDAESLEELFRETINGIATRTDMQGALEHMIRASAMVVEMIKDAPTIDAEPVRHGRIIKLKRWGEWPRCNLCDGTAPIAYNYCPNCGAKMDGGDHA